MDLNLKNIDWSQWELKNMYEWPFYGRLVIFIIVFVGTFYAGYFFDFSRLSQDIYTRYKHEQDLKEQLHSIYKIERDMRSIVSYYPEMLALLNQWQGQLIESEHFPELMNQILKIGAANHLTFSYFAPGDKKAVDDYYQVPISVLIQGNYQQIAHFMSELANLPQLLTISDFALIKKAPAVGGGENKTEAAEGSHYLTAALTLEVYYRAHQKQ